MYYVLHRPYESDLPWSELPGFRFGKDAREAVRLLEKQVTKDGRRVCNVKLCVGRGRDRRDILRL